MAVYGTNHQEARALCSQSGEQTKNRWLVGTLGPFSSENQLHLIEYDEDTDQISACVYSHPQEIWSLSANPTVASQFVSCHHKVDASGISEKATLWEFENLDETLSGTGALHELNTFLVPKIHMTKFHPTDPLLLGIGYKSCAVFGLESGQQTKVDPCQDLGDFVHCGTWNTHDTKSCVLGLSKDILEWDTRQERPQILVRDAHELSVRNLDFNPNKPFQFASCGDDCQVRIWDQRSTAQPLMSLSDHSHWVWNVLYNPSHDQLLLTSGSDCQVNLQSIVSVSSVPSLSTDPDSDDESPTSKTTDGLVSSYQQHEESVYGISWSSADPWIFASLSYDGRLLVNFVPQEHKYKIIL